MEFHKWPKIENLEAERLRNSKAFQKAWEVENWVVSEKIDGTNIGLNIGPDGHWKLSSRNQFVDGNFYGIGSAWPQLLPLIELLTGSMIEEFAQFTLQGEFFGTKVMGRINYGVPQAFRWFGAYSIHKDKGYERWPFALVEQVLDHCGMASMLVPVLGRCRHFEEALAMARAQASFFNPAQLMEGVVIQPLDYPIEPEGLIFKWKRPDFRENRLPSLKPTDADRAVIDALNAEFKGYITESRMVSVISKMDRPKSVTDFKPYASAIFNDAWADFCADHPGLELSAGDEKAVRNVGSLAYFTFQQTYQKFFKE